MPAEAAAKAKEWLSTHKPDDDPELYSRVQKQLALYEQKTAPRVSRSVPLIVPAMGNRAKPEPPEVTVEDITPESFGDPVDTEEPQGSSLYSFVDGEPVLEGENDLLRDETARNLSKMRGDASGDWYREPQDLPPSAAHNPMTVRWWSEPTPEMVIETLRQRPDLRARLKDDGGITIPAGKRGSTPLSEEDDLYKKTADILYAEEYDRMKSQGRGILRASQMSGPETSTWQRLGVRLTSGLNDVANAVGSGLNTATLGLFNATGNALSPPGLAFGDEASRDQQTAPALLGVPADLAGAFSPGSLPSRITGGLNRALGRGGQIAGNMEGGFLRNATADAGVGALSGGLQGGIQAVNERAFTDRELSMKETARQAIESALLGGAIGGLTSPLGRAGGGVAGRIKDQNPDIATLERGGGKVSPFGVDYPQKLNKLITEHRENIETSGSKLTPEESLLGEIGSRYANAGSDMMKAQIKEASDLSTAYYRTKEAKKPQAMKNLLQHALSEYEKSIGKGGRRLPGDKEKPWLQLAAESSIGIPMQNRSRRPNHTQMVLGADEAEKMFGKQWVEEARARVDMEATGRYPVPDFPNQVFNPGTTVETAAPKQVPITPDLTFAVVPRSVPADEMDRVIENFRSQVGEAKANRTAKQRSLEAAERAARADRQGFKGNKATGGKSWADVQFEMSQKLDAASDTLEAGGLPRSKLRRREDVFDPSILTPAQRKKMNQTLAAYMGKEGPEARAAMKLLATNSGTLEALEELATLKAGERVDTGQSLAIAATDSGATGRLGATGVARGAYSAADLIGTDAFDKWTKTANGSKVLSALQMLRGATGANGKSGPLKQALSMRSGAMARAAAAQDVQNLQTLVDVAYLIGQHRKEWEMEGEE